MDEQSKVIIVGAGITGLSVAWRLAQNNVPFILIESSSRPGGQIRTLTQNGYVFETGPNTSSISNPEVIELFEYLSPDAEIEVASETAKKRLVLFKGHLKALPDGPVSGVFTPLFTLRDKIKVLGEPFYRKGNNPYESVGKLAERRLGKSIVNYAVDPFVGGIYAGDPYKLTTKFALPKLYALEQTYGSFIKGAIRKMREPRTARDKLATKEVFSAQGGLETIVDALAEKVSRVGKIYFSSHIDHVEQLENSGWRVSFTAADGEKHVTEANYYVTTVRSDKLDAILPNSIIPHLTPIQTLRYAPIWEVAVGFDHYKGDNTQSFGVLVPSVEKRNLLGILYPSDCFALRVPYDDSRLFTLFMGGERDYDKLKGKTEDEIIRIALDELYNIQSIPHSLDPSLVHLSFFEKAIPQYGPDSGERLNAIRFIEERFTGLFLAGAIRDGIGMAHRIKQGSDIGLAIVKKELY